MIVFRTTLAAVLALAASAAAAQDVRDDGLVSEVRAGVLAHDVPLLTFRAEPGLAANAEILFRSPRLLDVIWSPRPHLGTTVSVEGETDQIYAGLTWTFRPVDRGRFAPVWFSAFGGGAVHDGQTDTITPDEKSLGSPVLFRFGAEIGYDIDEHLSISAFYAHVSNAFIADRNEGLDNAGVRIGWRF